MPAKVSALQSDSGWRAREGSQFSQPQLSPPRSSSEFHPRLYPGSARAASLNRQSPPSEPAFGRTSRIEEFGKFHRSFGSASSSGGSISSSFGRSRPPPSEQVNWEDLLGPGQAGLSLRGDRKPLLDETLTPKAEVATDPMRVNLDLNIQQTTSPSLATISSPASSALGHSPLYGQYEVGKIISLDYSRSKGHSLFYSRIRGQQQPRQLIRRPWTIQRIRSLPAGSASLIWLIAKSISNFDSWFLVSVQAPVRRRYRRLLASGFFPPSLHWPRLP